MSHWVWVYHLSEFLDHRECPRLLFVQCLEDLAHGYFQILQNLPHGLVLLPSSMQVIKMWYWKLCKNRSRQYLWVNVNRQGSMRN